LAIGEEAMCTKDGKAEHDPNEFFEAAQEADREADFGGIAE
jgi:hypothetical protein